MHIYAIINQKGGVGKSTTAAALWAGLTMKGFKTLAVDLDAQANLSFIVGADTSGKTALSLLTEESPAAETIRHLDSGDIIPASKNLAGIDAVLDGTGREYRLKEALEPIQDNYDYIIIDTPPQLGIMTINALTACGSVIIPAQADILSLQGIEQLTQTMKPVKKYCNPGLEIAGILLTRYSSRAALTRDLTEYTKQLAEKLKTRVFGNPIREGIAVKEAQINRRSLFDYAPKAKATEDYAAFIEELLNAEKTK